MPNIASNSGDRVLAFKDISGRLWVIPRARIVGLTSADPAKGAWGVIVEGFGDEWIRVTAETGFDLLTILAGETMSAHAYLTDAVERMIRELEG